MLISYYNDERKSYLSLSKKVREPFLRSDKTEAIHYSSLSANLSQGGPPKKSYYQLKNKLKSVMADGIIVAHTGSLIGYLYASKPENKTIFAAKEILKEQGLEPCYGEIF